MNKVPGKIKISYLLVEIFERPLNIPKRPSLENIGIIYNYGPGVRGTNAQHLPSSIWEHSHLCQDFLFKQRLLWGGKIIKLFTVTRNWCNLAFEMRANRLISG